jgi:hypothetical protein
VPRWKPGLAKEQITAEMRAERDRLLALVEARNERRLRYQSQRDGLLDEEVRRFIREELGVTDEKEAAEAMRPVSYEEPRYSVVSRPLL